MIPRSSPFLLAVLLMAGCSSIFGAGGPHLSIALRVDAEVERRLALEVEVGGDAWHLDEPRTIHTHAPRSGELPVTVRLLASSQVLATESYTKFFSDDHDHWIHAWVGQNRPIGHCIGGLTVIPLGAAADTLFLLNGSIHREVIC